MSHSPQSNAGHNMQAKTLKLVYNFMACHTSKHGGDLEVCSPFHFLVCLQAMKQASTEGFFSTFLHRACACWEVVGFWGTSLMAGPST